MHIPDKSDDRLSFVGIIPDGKAVNFQYETLDWPGGGSQSEVFVGIPGVAETYDGMDIVARDHGTEAASWRLRKIERIFRRVLAPGPASIAVPDGTILVGKAWWEGNTPTAVAQRTPLTNSAITNGDAVYRAHPRTRVNLSFVGAGYLIGLAPTTHLDVMVTLKEHTVLETVPFRLNLPIRQDEMAAVGTK